MSQSVSLNTVQTLEMLLVQARSQIVKYLPRHLDADKMIYVALETVRADSSYENTLTLAGPGARD